MNMLRSERVRGRRRELNISQIELSKMINVRQAQISRYENYETQPTLENLYALAKALQTTPDYLLGKSENPEMVIPDNLSKLDHRTQKYRVEVIGKISAGGSDSTVLAYEDRQGFLETDLNVQFALVVRGDSMEPLLLDGDVVLVQETPVGELRDGDLVVAIVNSDEAIVKQIELVTAGCILRSVNPEHKSIFIAKERFDVDCRIIGRVLQSQRNFYGGGVR